MRLVRFGWVPLVVLFFASPLLAETKAPDKAAPAQAKHMEKSPEEMAKNAVAKWKETLKLTEEQTPQFEAVMMDSYKKMAEAKTAAGADKAKMKASMQTIFKEREESLAKFLTPDQMKVYQQKVAQAGKEAKAHMAKTQEGYSK